MLFPTMAVLYNLGKSFHLFVSCVLRIIVINSVTFVSHGGGGGGSGEMLLHSKLNTVHVESQYTAGVALTTVRRLSINRCLK